MANIVTREEVKTFLKITGTADDDFVDALIPAAEARFKSELWIDTILSANCVEKVPACSNVFHLRNWPVTSVSKVNGTAYSGVLGTDFDVSFGRRLEILDLHAYLVGLKFGLFSLEYVAGYDSDEVPEDFKTAVRLLCGAMYNSNPSQGLASYAIGEEKVTFQSMDEASAYSAIVSRFKNR